MFSNILIIVYFNYHHLCERRGVITTADIKRRDRVVGVSRAFMVFRRGISRGVAHVSKDIQAASSLLNVAIPVKMNSDVTNKPCRTDHFVRWIAAIAA